MVNSSDAVNYYQLGHWEASQKQYTSEYWVLRVRANHKFSVLLSESYPPPIKAGVHVRRRETGGSATSG